MERKALCIDWSGTLSTSKFWGHLDDDKFNLIQDVLFRGELKPMLNPWMLGEINFEDIVAALSLHTGLNQEELLEGLKYSTENMQLVSANVLTLVGQIRSKGMMVVIATDNMDTFTRWTIPALGLEKHFDAILNSSDLKARKKDFDIDGTNKFFRQFLAENNLQPTQIILIDDSEDKENALSKFGIDYRKIEAGIGLVSALEKILEEI